ncbi:MAG TPA: hypothetical protein VK776_07970 [Bryobacteraceae bacterium]|jgi:hypothetical protein|nr:hypothetical protein [Bryobacteraceae bacterium]
MPAPVEQTHEYDRGGRATEELRKHRHASEELAEGYEAVLAERLFRTTSVWWTNGAVVGSATRVSGLIEK